MPGGWHAWAAGGGGEHAMAVVLVGLEVWQCSPSDNIDCQLRQGACSACSTRDAKVRMVFVLQAAVRWLAPASAASGRRRQVAPGRLAFQLAARAPVPCCAEVPSARTSLPRTAQALCMLEEKWQTADTAPQGPSCLRCT